MSHDIIAISKKSGEIISKISISPFDYCKSWILYESLNCDKFNKGVNGNGKEKVLKEKELRVALSKFKYLLGEDENEVINKIKSTAPFKLTVNILKNILRYIKQEEIKEEQIPIFNRDKLLCIEKFLMELQDKGTIILVFK